MSSKCLEIEDLSAGRRLSMQLWYGTRYMHQYKQSSRQNSVFDTNRNM
jgi:hypothetical protein